MQTKNIETNRWRTCTMKRRRLVSTTSASREAPCCVGDRRDRHPVYCNRQDDKMSPSVLRLHEYTLPQPHVATCNWRFGRSTPIPVNRRLASYKLLSSNIWHVTHGTTLLHMYKSVKWLSDTDLDNVRKGTLLRHCHNYIMWSCAVQWDTAQHNSVTISLVLNSQVQLGNIKSGWNLCWWVALSLTVALTAKRRIGSQQIQDGLNCQATCHCFRV